MLDFVQNATRVLVQLLLNAHTALLTQVNYKNEKTNSTITIYSTYFFRKMKINKDKAWLLFYVITALMLGMLMMACEQRMSTEELTQEIKQNMIEYFAENDDVANIKLVDLKLVHKGGNEYKGMADVIIENPVADLLNDWSEQDILNKNVEVTYSVEVIYDGEMFSWEIQE